MLHHWLKPLPKAFVERIDGWPEHTLGRQVRVASARGACFDGAKVALLGAGEAPALAVREYLYRMSGAFPHHAVMDVGNLRRDEPAFLRAVLFELLQANILPVVIAADDDFAQMQFLAYEEVRTMISLAVVDGWVRPAEAADLPWIEQRAYGVLLKPRHPRLFHFAHIGSQVHQVPEGWSRYLSAQHFDLLRLGKSRAAVEEAEPLLRDADLLCFHLDALKAAEAPGVPASSPAGYTWEEACQLCRYAGLSDKLSSLGIYGFVQERCAQTARGVAQLIWYFLDGFFHRKGDFPLSTDGLKEYIVDFRELNFQLTFWKSMRSGRWWLQAPSASAANHGRHYLVPCSFQDYQAACREELPERLLQALHRFA
jgi:formiminoglutamase